jgi:hypothetical protein
MTDFDYGLAGRRTAWPVASPAEMFWPDILCPVSHLEGDREFADSALEGDGFEPSVPRETERLLDGRSCWPPRAIESRRAIEGGPSYATHPVENRREGLCSNYFRRTRALALPTAGHDMTWPCNSPCLPRRA